MIYLALGRRQLGKTTLTYSMARRCPARIVFDPRGQIASDGVRVSGVETFHAAVEQMMEDPSLLSEIIVTPGPSDTQILFDQCAARVRDWAQDFEHASRATHRLMFLIDEARFVDLRASPSFEYVTRAAPPDLVNVAITAHRPIDVHTDVRAISDHWLMFRCTQEHDLKVIRERCTEAVAGEVSKLDPHQFVHWDDSTATATVNKRPETWFVPLRSHVVRSAPVDELAMLPDADSLPEPKETRSVDSGRLFEP